MSEQTVPYGYLNGHSHSHFMAGADQLSFDDIMPWGNPATGDILVATTVNGRIVFRPYNIVVPGGAALRNALVLDQNDTKPTYKPTLDATLPVIVTPGGAGAAGTSLIYSHRDHDHPATDVASAAALNQHLALEYRTKVATSQQLTSNSTVFQNITNMALPIAGTEVWRFNATILFISTVAADFKFQFTVPAAAVLFFSTLGFILGGVPTHAISIGAGVSTTVDGLAANVGIELQGTVVCGGTSGNMQLQAAQNTATVETTDFVVAGSNLVAWRVL